MTRLTARSLKNLVVDTEVSITVRTPLANELVAADRKNLENTLFAQIHQHGLPAPEREYLAIPGRAYRWDMAWPQYKLLVEVNGGTWQTERTGHSTGAGLQRDYAKLNRASMHGWWTLMFDSQQVNDHTAVTTIEEFILTYTALMEKNNR